MLLPRSQVPCLLITFNFWCWRSVRLRFCSLRSKVWYKIILVNIISYCFVKKVLKISSTWWQRSAEGRVFQSCSRSQRSARNGPLSLLQAPTAYHKWVACYPFPNIYLFILSLFTSNFGIFRYLKFLPIAQYP